MTGGRSWSIPLGRVAGIRIRLHLSFLLLLVLVAGAGSGSAALSELWWITAVFASVVAHELAHSVVARRFGVTVRDILLLPIGGVSEMESMPEEPAQELAIAVAGPGASLALAGLGFLACAILGTAPWPPALFAGPVPARLGWLNALLAGFNLLPALPLDGGRALRAGLAMRMPRERATQIAARMGRAGGVALVLAGVAFDFWLVLIGAFVYLGATAEAQAEETRRALVGLRVDQAMVWSPWVAPVGDRLTGPAALEACRRQGVLPVVAPGGRYFGTVGPREAAAVGSSDQPAGSVADRAAPTLRPEDPLDGALDLLRRSGRPGLAVVGADGVVVGVLAVGDVSRALAGVRPRSVAVGRGETRAA